MAGAGEPINTESQTVLRTMGAREVVFLTTGGAYNHVRVRKEEDTKTLVVEVWWDEDASSERRQEAIVTMQRRMNLWVWEGWTVQIHSSAQPKPDVLWDPYAAKFVPRKAYRPLGTPGRINGRRTG